MSLLRVDNLVRDFGGNRAVDGMSFEIAQGSITALIGPNGAGKTTTFNLIAGSLSPTSGTITFGGIDITGTPGHRLFHHGIVRTFQIPHEYAKLTAHENLMVAAPDQPGEQIFLNWFARASVRRRESEILRRADDALAFLGLSHVRDVPAGSLSGGQKKLLELGRTMMSNPRLVLLDEPAAGVNPSLMEKIGDMIRTLNAERGYTFCIIEHDMALVAALCDPIIVMASGKVLSTGTMDDVRADERVVDAYFGDGE